MENGGIIDKPGRHRDYYHTCYGLSGLSVSQYYCDQIVNICTSDQSLLNRTHPLFNISNDAAFNAIEYFKVKNVVSPVDD
jgi:prenyltransferase beta subunit